MTLPQQFSVAALGVGNVGANFLGQLSQLSQRLSKSSAAPIYISLVFAANSRKALYHNDYQPLPVGSAVADLQAGTDARDAPSIDKLVDFLAKAPGKVILVDNTASQAVADAYPAFLKKGVSVVASNKKAFSSKHALFSTIYSTAGNNLFRTGSSLCDGTAAGVRPGFIYHESSVGAGLPIISTVKDLVETGDKVVRIEGIFSGTMSYLFNQFMPLAGDSLGFAAAVAKAKEEGFTEPDARDDLNGLDVARKLVILARICGWELETDGFPVESLVPEGLVGCSSGDDFLARLPEFDQQMDELKAAAAAEGKVIRYVGSLDFGAAKARVGMQKFDASSPIAGIKGSDNIISFFTERYGEQPLIVQGAGAGGAVTAMGVTSDVLKTIRVMRGSN